MCAARAREKASGKDVDNQDSDGARANKRNLIEDTRNELENAFGPLYDIFNEEDKINHETNLYIISKREKLRMDNIFSTRP